MFICTKGILEATKCILSKMKGDGGLMPRNLSSNPRCLCLLQIFRWKGMAQGELFAGTFSHGSEWEWCKCTFQKIVTYSMQS